jgi:lambda family phage portal protein
MGVRNILSLVLSPISSTLAAWVGGYNILDPRRKVVDKIGHKLNQNKTTANQLLNAGGQALRAYCRELERNNPSARAGVEALKALLVGTGIALEPDTGNESLDQQIRDYFNQWVSHAGVHGETLYELQGLGVGDLVTCGEGIWRFVFDEDAVDDDLPLRILPLDAEWFADDEGSTNDLTTVAGIVLDKLGRPRTYLLRNPEYSGSGGAEQVPAASIAHFFERRRPVQHRGEPWFAPVIETLINERDLVDAELKGAVTTASLGIAVESEYHQGVEDNGDEYLGDDPVQAVGLGSVVRLFPGEKVHAFSHTRPSQMIAPFRQMLRGDIAAALRIPQRFLDRDVSRANYSSMRADMIDTERLLAPVREWLGHQTIGRAYQILLPFIAARMGIAVPRADYRLVPDSQPYVDPQKDVAACLTAIEGGLTTYEKEIGKRGEDYRQVWAQLAKEKQLLASLDISPRFKGEGVVEAIQPPAPVAEVEEEDEEEEKQDDEDDKEEDEKEERSALLHHREIERIRAGAPIVNMSPVMHVPAQPAPVVNVSPSSAEVRIDVQPTPVYVEAPNVTVEAARAADAPQIVVNVPEQPAPVVNVAAPNVTIENEVIVPQRTIKATPNRDGSVTMRPVDE